MRVRSVRTVSAHRRPRIPSHLQCQTTLRPPLHRLIDKVEATTMNSSAFLPCGVLAAHCPVVPTRPETVFEACSLPRRGLWYPAGKRLIGPHLQGCQQFETKFLDCFSTRRKQALSRVEIHHILRSTRVYSKRLEHTRNSIDFRPDVAREIDSVRAATADVFAIFVGSEVQGD